MPTTSHVPSPPTSGRASRFHHLSHERASCLAVLVGARAQPPARATEAFTRTRPLAKSSVGALSGRCRPSRIRCLRTAGPARADAFVAAVVGRETRAARGPRSARRASRRKRPRPAASPRATTTRRAVERGPSVSTESPPDAESRFQPARWAGCTRCTCPRGGGYGHAGEAVVTHGEGRPITHGPGIEWGWGTTHYPSPITHHPRAWDRLVLG